MGEVMRSYVRGASRPLWGAAARRRHLSRWVGLRRDRLVGAVDLLDRGQRGAQQLPEPANLAEKPLALGRGGKRDAAGLVVRLLDDELRGPAGLLPVLLGGCRRGDGRLAEERLEVAVALELLPEVLEPVGEIGASAPDVLVAVRDLVEQSLDGTAAVAPEAASDRDMPDLCWCEAHR